MAASFPHTLRALETNGTRPTIFGLILITALLTVWSAWLLRGQVAVYEVSTAARLEVEHVHAVGATVGGRVAASYLALGRRVRRGDVLLEIEADRETLETNEERTRLTSLNGQLAVIATEIVKEEPRWRRLPSGSQRRRQRSRRRRTRSAASVSWALEDSSLKPISFARKPKQMPVAPTSLRPARGLSASGQNRSRRARSGRRISAPSCASASRSK
ncbi:MAG: hypothetical protein DMF97_12960, partial [Acidobacteria bacterium]